MRIVHNYNLRYHIEKELCPSFQDLSSTYCGRPRQLQPWHSRQSVLAVSIFPYEATALLELFYV